jgi:hypothetical protein
MLPDIDQIPKEIIQEGDEIYVIRSTILLSIFEK